MCTEEDPGQSKGDKKAKRDLVKDYEVILANVVKQPTLSNNAAISVYLCIQRLSKAILSSFCCNFNQNICIILYLHILPQLVVLKFFPVLYFGNMY